MQQSMSGDGSGPEHERTDAAVSRARISTEGLEQAKVGEFRIKDADMGSKVRACGTRLLLLPRPPRLLSHLLLYIR
jgi:hypothetical protein